MTAAELIEALEMVDPYAEVLFVTKYKCEVHSIEFLEKDGKGAVILKGNPS